METYFNIEKPMRLLKSLKERLTRSRSLYAYDKGTKVKPGTTFQSKEIYTRSKR